MNDQRDFVTAFTETDKGNYISVGSKGLTYVMEYQGGWHHGTAEKGVKSLPTPSEDSQRYLSPTEAIREASVASGFVIYAKDKQKNMVSVAPFLTDKFDEERLEKNNKRLSEKYHKGE